MLSNKPFHLTPASRPSIAPAAAGERQRSAVADRKWGSTTMVA